MRIVKLEHAPSKSIGERGTKHRFFEEAEGKMGISISVNRLKRKSAPGSYHLHRKSSSVYYVLRGKALFVVNGRKTTLGKDASIFLDKNEPHSISNAGSSELLILEIYSPANPDYVEVKKRSLSG